VFPSSKFSNQLPVSECAGAARRLHLLVHAEELRTAPQIIIHEEFAMFFQNPIEAIGRTLKRANVAKLAACLLLASSLTGIPMLSADAKALAIGDTAPDFTLKADDGTTVKLSDFKNKKNVVVFFYYKDDTPVCTKESCAFKDSYEKFKVANAEVFGVSSDPVESHQKFKKENSLPYELLSDPDGTLRKEWGVPTVAGMPGRFTYVIDKNGVVKKIYGGMFESKKHVIESLRALGDVSISAY
jgi:thioredoxin-dependent peroxiredoxin